MIEVWTDALDQCKDAEVAESHGGSYQRNGRFQQDKTYNSTTAVTRNGVSIYGLSCGIDKSDELATFVLHKLVYELLLEEDQNITDSMTEEEVLKTLSIKYKRVLADVKGQQEEHLTQILLAKESPYLAHDIPNVENKLRAGCTVLLVIRIRENLYMLNCGHSRAIIAHRTPLGMVHPRTLNEIHVSLEKEERDRLTAIGCDCDKIQLYPSRAIGDYYRSSLEYAKKPEFAELTSAPVISTPDLQHIPLSLEDDFLLLVSPGLMLSLEELNPELNPDMLETLLTTRVFKKRDAMRAQAVLDDLSREHQASFHKSHEYHHRDEMTMIFIALHDETIDSTMQSVYNSLQSEAQPDLEPYVDLDDFDARVRPEQLARLMEIVSPQMLAHSSNDL